MDSIDEQRFKRMEEQLQEILHVLRMHANQMDHRFTMQDVQSKHLAEMTVLRLQADIFERMPKRS
ncbi:hypothetical protein [Pseudoduganella sp.]|uniref:hypothetical protein n=1 Tax=Pseudoduganella sp. TaxID=1880898 RepID=UPI0035B1F703